MAVAERMELIATPAIQRAVALTGIVLLLAGAVLVPWTLLRLLPVFVLGLCALAFYQFPRVQIALLVLTCGLGLDLQVENTGIGGGMGAAAVKLVPFAIAGALLLRYGPSRAINWPFITFAAIAGLSIALLPIGRIATDEDMMRSFIGSTAPFVIAFAAAPKRVWTALIRGAALVPLISAVMGVPWALSGIGSMFDAGMRFQGMHSPPFLAGFCVTAVFAAVLEYLRGFNKVWLVVGSLNLAILLATQARAPSIAIGIFLLLVFLLSDRRVFPLQRKVDLVMGGLIPGGLVLGPVLVLALDRFTGMADNFSGRDIIWPYFLDAIQTRPLLGYGLGAGKLIVDPEDPRIRLIGSNAAHNEYLRLSVDAGILGCAAIFLSIIAWIWLGSRNIARGDRLVLRCALLAALIHSGFDNTLIASTALMQFSFFGAALARGRAEARERATAAARRHRPGEHYLAGEEHRGGAWQPAG